MNNLISLMKGFSGGLTGMALILAGTASWQMSANPGLPLMVAGVSFLVYVVISIFRK